MTLEFRLPEPDEVKGKEARKIRDEARETEEYEKLFNSLGQKYGVRETDWRVFEAVLEMCKWETVVVFEMDIDVDHSYCDISIVFNGGEVTGAGAWIDIYDPNGHIRKTETHDIVDGSVKVKSRKIVQPDPNHLASKRATGINPENPQYEEMKKNE